MEMVADEAVLQGHGGHDLAGLSCAADRIVVVRPTETTDERQSDSVFLVAKLGAR